MNAVFKPTQSIEAQLERMTPGWLSGVARVEQSAYKHPWTMGNFNDSLNAGYMAQLLTAGSSPNAALLGYFVAMKGVDETHLLNLTVAPAYQRQGWARVMLDALALWPGRTVAVAGSTRQQQPCQSGVRALRLS